MFKACIKYRTFRAIKFALCTFLQPLYGRVVKQRRSRASIARPAQLSYANETGWQSAGILHVCARRLVPVLVLWILCIANSPFTKLFSIPKLTWEAVFYADNLDEQNV